MTFETVLKLTEVMLALALIQQSLEHVRAERWPHVPRLLLSGCVVLGIGAGLAIWGLLLVQLWLLHRHQGPYNGGSDKMALLILSVLSVVHAVPDRFWQEMALSYLAAQLVLSYVISGWVKLRNPAWRRGDALVDVFRFSAYPVSEDLRTWADRPRVLFVAGWAVILIEVLFPIALLTPDILIFALGLTACFHLANAVCFGLHRFFWIWICAYPSLIWFQERAVGPLLAT